MRAARGVRAGAQRKEQKSGRDDSEASCDALRMKFRRIRFQRQVCVDRVEFGDHALANAALGKPEIDGDCDRRERRYRNRIPRHRVAGPRPGDSVGKGGERTVRLVGDHQFVGRGPATAVERDGAEVTGDVSDRNGQHRTSPPPDRGSWGS